MEWGFLENQPAARSDNRSVEMVTLDLVDSKPVPWLWEGRIPSGAMTLFTGDSGAGKTTFTAWLLAQITNGTLPGKHYGRPSDVVYIAHEDVPEYTIVPRMRAAGADMSKVWIIEDGTERMNLPVGVNAIRDAVVKSDAVAVVLDPLLSFMDIRDENKKVEVRRALNPLAKVLAETGVAGLCIHHPNKATTQDLESRAAGSAAFREVARSTINILRDPETDIRYVGVEKCNLGGKLKTCATFNLAVEDLGSGITAAKFVRDGSAGMSIHELYDKFRAGREIKKKNAADVPILSKAERVAEEIDKLLANGELSRQTIVERVTNRMGVSVRTVDSALKTSRYRSTQRKDETDGKVKSFYRTA